MTTVRVRFAPSPTGHLHLGGVRTAIFNWLFAKHNNGSYVLRIEDTDRERSTKEYLDSQLHSLNWLGLKADEEPIFQMSRVEHHARVAQQLIDMGKAYRCYCEPRDMNDVQELHEQGVGQKYPGTCAQLSGDHVDGRPYAIRFRLPSDQATVSFNDIIRGTVSVGTDQLDDFVIFRRDGSPTYNFCVVLDDIFMRITHVIRGEDHISNTSKQVLLYQALDENMPKFAHLPLILGKSGGKLSKRDAAVSVNHYREQGYLPDALLNYLVRLGWAHGDQEVFTREELIQLFTLEAVGKKGSVFDVQKLMWLNGVYMRQASSASLLTLIEQMDAQMPATLAHVWQPEQLNQLVDLYKERTVTLRQLCDGIVSLANQPETLDFNLIAKWRVDHLKALVQTFADQSDALPVYDAASLLPLAKQVCAQFETKLVTVAQSLRLALTGTVKSPGVFHLLQVLGREKSQKRIAALLQQL